MENLNYILNSFLFIFAGILVMWMSAGFTMLEAGLTRTKNNVTVLTKNVGLFSLSCLTFYVIGYNLMYGSGNGFIGDFSIFNLNIPNEKHSLGADFFFQMMFVATAASVISGAVAERMKILPFFIFTIILSAFIYPIVGHWTWGGTYLYGLIEGFSDFAGSTIVHSVGGWAALAGVLILGARKGKYTKDGKLKPILGSNLAIATLGTFILWMGWFGFNGGSQLSMSSKEDIDSISNILVITQIGACSGLLGAMFLSYFLYKKIDLTLILNGILGGLVSITAGPNLGFGIAFIEGFIGGIIVVLAIMRFDRFKIDDPVGALSVHLVCGIWGTLAVGIFSKDVSFISQLKGVFIIGGFVFISSFILWKILDIIIGLRVEDRVEYEGLDLEETGLEAYPEFKRN